MKSQPESVDIAEVAVDASGRVVVTPAPSAQSDFSFIYRAAMEVTWIPETKSLVGGVPREWSKLRWFNNIVGAVLSEYGIKLVCTPSTRWTNVHEELRKEIEAWSKRA
jgi:hypothetical protein